MTQIIIGPICLIFGIVDLIIQSWYTSIIGFGVWVGLWVSVSLILSRYFMFITRKTQVIVAFEKNVDQNGIFITWGNRSLLNRCLTRTFDVSSDVFTSIYNITK